MRISDWSSDVCSSDLLASLPAAVRQAVQDFYRANEDWLARVLEQGAREGSLRVPGDLRTAARSTFAALPGSLVDRKSVVSGKSVSVRVDLGGSRNIKKKRKIK